MLLSLVVIRNILLREYCLPNLFSCQKSSAIVDYNRYALWSAPELMLKHQNPGRLLRHADTDVRAGLKHYLRRVGGAERDRTVDPLLAKQVLSQLSYSPISQDVAAMPLRPLALLHFT